MEEHTSEPPTDTSADSPIEVIETVVDIIPPLYPIIETQRYTCRICLNEDTERNLTRGFCACKEDLSIAHPTCLLRWIRTRDPPRETCEICRSPFLYDSLSEQEPFANPVSTNDSIPPIDNSSISHVCPPQRECTCGLICMGMAFILLYFIVASTTHTITDYYALALAYPMTCLCMYSIRCFCFRRMEGRR